MIVNAACGGGSTSATVTTCVQIPSGTNGVGVFGVSSGGNLTNLLTEADASITITSSAQALPFFIDGTGGVGSQNIFTSDHSIGLYNAGPYLSGNGNHLVSSATITLASGAGSHTFATPYSTAPVCTANDTTAADAVKVSSSTTAITLAGTGTDVIAWVCTPAAN